MKHTIAGFLLISSLSLTGCATVFKGYRDEVKVVNYREGMEVTNQYGEQINVIDKIRTKVTANPYVSVNPYVKNGHTSDTVITGKIALLETSEDQVLTVRFNGQERTIVARRRLGLGWLILDTLLGLYPAFIDAYTGCWNKYDTIDLAME